MSVSGGGRLPAALDAAMVALNASVHIDSELWREDISGSLAHARGLGRIGVLSAAEVEQISQGLQQIASEIERGEFHWDVTKEDVHMNIELRPVCSLVPAGTTRSRPICGSGCGAKARSSSAPWPSWRTASCGGRRNISNS